MYEGGDSSTIKENGEHKNMSNLVTQLDQLFTRESILGDVWLANELTDNLTIPVNVLVQHPSLKSFELTQDLIYEASQTASNFEYIEGQDQQTTHIKAKLDDKRTTLIFRQMPDNFGDDEMIEFLTKCPNITSKSDILTINKEFNNTWFVKLNDEILAQNTLSWMRSQTLQDKPIEVRLKSNPSIKQFLSLSKSNTKPITHTYNFSTHPHFPPHLPQSYQPPHITNSPSHTYIHTHTLPPSETSPYLIYQYYPMGWNMYGSPEFAPISPTLTHQPNFYTHAPPPPPPPNPPIPHTSPHLKPTNYGVNTSNKLRNFNNENQQNRRNSTSRQKQNKNNNYNNVKGRLNKKKSNDTLDSQSKDDEQLHTHTHTPHTHTHTHTHHTDTHTSSAEVNEKTPINDDMDLSNQPSEHIPDDKEMAEFPSLATAANLKNDKPKIVSKEDNDYIKYSMNEIIEICDNFKSMKKYPAPSSYKSLSKQSPFRNTHDSTHQWSIKQKSRSDVVHPLGI